MSEKEAIGKRQWAVPPVVVLRPQPSSQPADSLVGNRRLEHITEKERLESVAHLRFRKTAHALRDIDRLREIEDDNASVAGAEKLFDFTSRWFVCDESHERIRVEERHRRA